jgi:hypothetical protein
MTIMALAAAIAVTTIARAAERKVFVEEFTDGG